MSSAGYEVQNAVTQLHVSLNDRKSQFYDRIDPALAKAAEFSRGEHGEVRGRNDIRYADTDPRWLR